MSLALKLSVGLYCLVGLLQIYGGLNYVLAPQFMGYHAAALQTSWEQVTPAYQGLIRALMIGMGAGTFTAGVSVIALALLGLRTHTAWCLWLLPVILVLRLGLVRYSNQVLYDATSGGPPDVVGIAVAALALAAIALSLVGWPRKS